MASDSEQQAVDEKDSNTKDEPSSTPPDFVKSHRTVFHAAHIVLSVILLFWPWAFVGAIWSHHKQGGIQASSDIASLVNNHPSAVDFFITTLTAIMAAAMTYIFTTAVMCIYRTRFIDHPEDLFVRFFKYLKKPPDEWPLGTVWTIISKPEERQKGLPLLFVLAFYSLVFTFIGPGLNALVIPHPFARTASFQGTELNFTSTDASCLGWISANAIPSTCNWMAYKDFQFTDCLGENQLIDVLESGRNNMRSLLSNNTETLTFTQLGGMHFFGPIQGVFPVGPNGIPAFNTLDSLPADMFKTALSYNYSLDLQGVSSSVRCQYDTSTPIVSSSTPPLNIYGATCPSGETVAPLGAAYPTPIGLNMLGAWPCKTSPLGGSYTVYFSGRENYADVIGNMSCDISPIGYSVFPVQYSSTGDLFTVSNETLSSSNATSLLLDRAVYAIVNTVGEAQGLTTNSVAESVITYGVRTFGLPFNGTYVQNDAYLRLVEGLIQGILQYEMTYMRLIYSSYSTPPDSCKRDITGQFSFEVIGWASDPKTAAYLLPLTIINLTALVLLILSFFMADAHRGAVFSEQVKDDVKTEVTKPVADMSSAAVASLQNLV